MPKFAANLSFLFTELPFLDRFDAAAAAGFSAVECLFPYEAPSGEIRKRLDAYGLKLALFNVSPGDWNAGDRGTAIFPDRFDELCVDVQRALDYALILETPNIHLMAGLGNANDQAARDAYRRAVDHAARIFAEHNINILLEPISPQAMPGYFLSDFERAADFIGQSADNVRLQFDFYHRQLMSGDALEAFKHYRHLVKHVQIAGVPGRHEPVRCAIDYDQVFSYLDATDYEGFVGCEYVPLGDTAEGLGWLELWRQ